MGTWDGRRVYLAEEKLEQMSRGRNKLGDRQSQGDQRTARERVEWRLRYMRP